MALILTDDQTQLRDSARDFLSEQSPVSALRQLRDSADADGFSRPLWARFAEMGYTGVLVPEAHGGLGLGHVEAGVVMDQIGRQLCASPLLASGIVATTALKLSEYRKLAPGKWEEIIFFDHPSGYQRVLMAMRWKAEHQPEVRMPDRPAEAK